MELRNLLSDIGEFETPSSWLWVELGELAESLQTGFPYGQHNQEGVGIPHLRPMNVSPTGEINLEQVKYVEVENYPNLEVGDVLFNNTNSPTWLGKTATILHENNWTFSNHMTRIRFYDYTLEPSCVGYYLHYLQMVGFFKLNCAHHVNQASINTTFLANDVLVPLPPLDEQTRIVDAIEALFSRLDAGIAALKRAQANLKRYKASVLKAACEGRLVPQDPEDEPASELLARILAERRARWEAEELANYEAKGKKPPKNWRDKYPEPQPPDTSDLPDLPEGWVWTSLDELIVEPFSNGHSVRSADVGFPVLRLTAIEDGRIDLQQAKTGEWQELDAQPYLVEHLDFFVSRGSGSLNLVGRGGLVEKIPYPVAYPDTMIRVRVNYDHVDSAYLALAWESPCLRTQIEKIAHTTAGIYKINQQHLSNFAVPLAPLTAQARIVAEAERRLSIIEELQNLIKTNLQRAERLRQSILKEAFAGRLVPQDLDDEPAGILLERIRAEREQRR